MTPTGGDPDGDTGDGGEGTPSTGSDVAGSDDVGAHGTSDGGEVGPDQSGGGAETGPDGSSDGSDAGPDGSADRGDAGAESIKLFGIHTAARVVGFLGLVYFANVLPQSELGIYFLFFLVVQVSSMVSQVGMTNAVVQRISGAERPDEIYSAAMVVIAVVTTAVTALLFTPGIRSAVASYVGVDVPGLIAVAVGGWLFADLHIRAVQGEDRVLLSGGLQLFQDVIRVGIGAVALAAGFGPVGLMYGVIAGFGATAVAGLAVTNVGLRRPIGDDFRSLFAISKYTALFGPTNFVYFWFDTFMIGLLLTKAAVSAYEVAWQTTRVLIIPTTAIVQTVFPKISAWASEGEYDEIERILPGGILFTLIIPLPGLVGLAVLGPEILSLVYRPTYSEAAVAMAILAGYMVIESLHRLGQVTATGLDRADIPFRSRLVGVALAVVLNVALIPPFGLLGAAVGTFVAKLVDSLILWYGVGRVVQVSLPLRPLAWEAGSAVAMGLVVLAGAMLVGVSSLPLLFAVVAVGVAVYGGLVLLDEDIHQVLEQYVPFDLPGG